MSSEVRHASVALTIDALLLQWARQDSAPDGSAYVVDREISPRRRGGALWQHPDSIAVGVVVRPLTVEPSSVDLLWVAASIAAAEGLTDLTDRQHRCVWPDRLEGPSGADFDVAITASAQFGPGRIDHGVLIVRVAPVPAERDRVADTLVDALRSSGRLLDHPGLLLKQYHDRCATLGCRVSASLLPRGSVRGVVSEVSTNGGLVLTSPTGHTESIAVAMLNELRTET